MATDLVLGVISVPYGQNGEEPDKPALTKKGKPRKQRKDPEKGVVTTDEVAQILEEKYGVMQAFYDLNVPEITGAMINSLEGVLEDIYLGAPVPSDPFAEAGQTIMKDFRNFLMSGVIEEMGVDGVPTKAALNGVNHRFKSKQGERRPSFIDTSLYEMSMRAWVEKK